MANDITKLIDLENLSTYKGLSDTAYEKKAVALTYSQYDDLSTAEKNNGTSYYITDRNMVYKNSVAYGVQSNWNESTSTALSYILNKPTALSAFTNDSGFVTNTVNDLVNYYTTSDTYTKTEVNSLITAIPKFKIEVVPSLLVVVDPNDHTVYLVPSSESETGNIYTEYIYVIDETTQQGDFEKIGTQDVDFSYTNDYLPGVTTIQEALDALVNIDKKDFWLSGSKGVSDTSVTFTDSRIVTTSVYEIYTADSNLMFTSTTLSTGSIVITFADYTHVNAIPIKVLVHNP